jgi:hypothetical protein
MLAAPVTRNLARRLLAYERLTATTLVDPKPAIVRLYEKLREQLFAPLGAAGFRVLASRALTLAKSKAPGLATIQVRADGFLQGLEELELPTGAHQENEVEVVFIEQFFDLFLNFLGDALTMQLVEDIYPDLKVTPHEGQAAVFENILREVSQLGSLSERLETLADTDPALVELLSIAGTIRNVGTMLEVFAVIRCKSDTLPKSEPEQQLKEYVM